MFAASAWSLRRSLLSTQPCNDQRQSVTLERWCSGEVDTSEIGVLAMKAFRPRYESFRHLGEFGVIVATGLSIAAVAATLLGLL